MIKAANMAYVLPEPRESGYRRPEPEKFENAAGLCAAILLAGATILVRRGLNRGYDERKDRLNALRGRSDWTETIRAGADLSGSLVCVCDEFVADIYLNRIIKTAFVWLLKAKIAGDLKKKIRAILPFFASGSELAPRSINWNQQDDRNSGAYRTPIFICRLILNGLLPKGCDSGAKIRDFLDAGKECALFEKFIRAYCRR